MTVRPRWLASPPPRPGGSSTRCSIPTTMAPPVGNGPSGRFPWGLLIEGDQDVGDRVFFARKRILTPRAPRSLRL